MRRYIEIESNVEAEKLLRGKSKIERYAFQCVDFTQLIVEVENVTFSECLFLGCKFAKSMRYNLDSSNTVLTSLKVPYSVFKTTLYTPKSLYDGYDWKNPESISECYDTKAD